MNKITAILEIANGNQEAFAKNIGRFPTVRRALNAIHDEINPLPFPNQWQIAMMMMNEAFPGGDIRHYDAFGIIIYWQDETTPTLVLDTGKKTAMIETPNNVLLNERKNHDHLEI